MCKCSDPAIGDYQVSAFAPNDSISIPWQHKTIQLEFRHWPAAEKCRAADLGHMVVIHLVPEAIWSSDKAVIVAAVHRVSRMHQHPKQLIHLRAASPVAHERPHVKLGLKVHLHKGDGLAFMLLSILYSPSHCIDA